MSWNRQGLLAALLVLFACGKEEAVTPAVTLLTPEGQSHKGGSFSPDGSQVAYWTAGAVGWDLIVARADLSAPRTLVSGLPYISPWPSLWSPDGTRIAYGSTTSNVDVAVVPAAGGEVRLLTSSPGFESPIEWHPKGDRIGYLATTEGGGLSTLGVSLTTGASAPLARETRPSFAHWSPDGSRIAYHVVDGGKATIWVADSAGSNARQLTTEGEEGLWGPGVRPWSPDGTELLYLSRRTGMADIWVLPVDGGTPRQLTRDIRDDEAPTWSPDGKWVAFISKRGRQTDVWVVPAAGGTELRVTDTPDEEDGLQWVGKGTTLAFHTGIAPRALWGLTLAGGAERQITPDSILVGAFDVSPTAAEVVYQVVRGGGVSELQVTAIEGGAPRTVVSGTSDNYDPDWSPDGKRILFTSTRSGSPDIWVVDAAGGEPRPLTTWPTNEYAAEWSADGSAVYFTSDREARPLADIWMVPAAGGEPRRVTTLGNVNSMKVSRNSPDIFVSIFGGRAGQFVLGKLLPDGKLQTLWDRGNSYGVSHYGTTPGGDSVVINAELPGGGAGTFLISTRTGQGRQLLGPNELGADLSRDGTQLIYQVGGANQDLAVYNLKDGSTRRLTNTPENEGSYWWTADGKMIVFSRSPDRRRIATVDLTGLLGGR